MAAAVGSLRSRSTFNPAMRAASFVAGAASRRSTPGRSPRRRRARRRGFPRRASEGNAGSRPTPGPASAPRRRLDADHPGASTNRYGSAPYLATSATPRPMNRFTDAMCWPGRRPPTTARRSDFDAAAGSVAHDGGQEHATVRIRQALCGGAAHGRHQRVRRAQVDADREPPLVRLGRFARSEICRSDI